MSVITNAELQRPKWRVAVVATLAFWMSASLLLDLVIMPGLYSAGMLTEPGFAAAGYSIFEMFNHLELLCAAVVLTGVLVLRTQKPTGQAYLRATSLALGMLAIVLIYTYELTPQMSALGMQLNWFDSALTVPAGMNQLHWSYWILELCKLAIGGTILRWCWSTAR